MSYFVGVDCKRSMSIERSTILSNNESCAWLRSASMYTSHEGSVMDMDPDPVDP
jgi:hypothetical protein